MTITIFGASGSVGRLITAEALRRGHKVIAFVHTHKLQSETSNLSFVEGDVYNAASVARAIAGSEVVISALSSWGTPGKDVLAAGMQNIIPAMQMQGISRIISLTGAEARAPGDALSLLHRLCHTALALIAGKVLKDGENHIRLLAQSDLDWTVIRSPIITDHGHPQFKLTVHRPLPWNTINRQAVATAMVDKAERQTTAQTSPYISRL